MLASRALGTAAQKDWPTHGVAIPRIKTGYSMSVRLAGLSVVLPRHPWGFIRGQMYNRRMDERRDWLWRLARDAAIVSLVVGVTLTVFLDDPEDIRRRVEQDRDWIRHRYQGPNGERVIEVTVVKPGEFDVLRESTDGKAIRFRARKSGSNWLRAVPAPDDDSPNPPAQ